jgi:CheY-like chemotaxis protein
MAGGLPIVMLRFDVRPEDSNRHSQTGLPGYAVKPVTRAHLRRLVCSALGVEMAEQATSFDLKSKHKVEPAKLLVVDDSPDNRLLVQAYLKGSPYQVTFETDGKAGVDRFASSDFDLILMDVLMPVMDGLEATRAIRAIELEHGHPPVPIVALTANASLQDIEKSVEAGCNAQLSKPISKVRLLSAIEKYRRRPESPEMVEAETLGPISGTHA